MQSLMNTSRSAHLPSPLHFLDSDVVLEIANLKSIKQEKH